MAEAPYAGVRVFVNSIHAIQYGGLDKLVRETKS
jgi:hypothetical protein